MKRALDRANVTKWKARTRLIAFFETNPGTSDSQEAEFFGSLSFVRDVGGGDVLRCHIGMSFSALRLVLSRDGSEQIFLSAQDVSSLRIERLHGVKTLVALFGREPDLREARLTLAPTLRLEWGSTFQG